LDRRSADAEHSGRLVSDGFGPAAQSRSTILQDIFGETVAGSESRAR
jgi:hypothetical protein